jgi:hypothetical protein
LGTLLSRGMQLLQLLGTRGRFQNERRLERPPVD